MLTPEAAMGAGTWIAAGWRIYRANWGRMMLGALALMGFYLLLVALGGGIGYILGPLRIPEVGEELPPWALVMLVILNLTVGIMLYLGFYYYALRLVRGRSPSIVQDLLYPFRRPLAVIGVAILYALAIMGGLALLIVPGIILAIRFYFAGIALIDRNLGVSEALKESSRLTRGHRLSLFLVLLFFIFVDAALKLAVLLFFALVLPVPLLNTTSELVANFLSLLVVTPWEAASFMCAYDALLEGAYPPGAAEEEGPDITSPA